MSKDAPQKSVAALPLASDGTERALRVLPRPKALDLFCGAGGAAMGLFRAGFDVFGVDHVRQPRYPFPYVIADALRPPVRLEDFDLVWASPPCQAHTAMRNMPNARKHVDLIPAVRAMLHTVRLSVIENVPGAPMRADAILCGTSFGLGLSDRDLRRHRWFECSFPIILDPPCVHRNQAIPILSKLGGYRRGVRRHGKGERQAAMGIGWMENEELSQAIPPAYSEHIGRYAMMAIRP